MPHEMKSGGGEVGKTSRFPRFLLDFPHVPPPSISFCILQLLLFLGRREEREMKPGWGGGRQN